MPSKDEIFIKTNDGYYYPLYVQVICKRQNTKFRSYIKPSNGAADFGIHEIDIALDNTSNQQLRKLIEKEKKSIQAVVSLLRPFKNEGFHLADFCSVYERAIIDLRSLIGNHCRRRMNTRKIAFERGPLVYCAEEIDNASGVLNTIVPKKGEFNFEIDLDLFGGLGKIGGPGKGKTESTTIKLIPYYAWAHREIGEMAVWLKAE